MKSIMIQFHATLEELVEYLNSMSSNFGLIITMMTFKPFALKQVEGHISISDFLLEGENADVRLMLSKGKLDLDASSPNNFLDINTGTVVFDIGRLLEGGLHESALAFMSDDKDKIAIANKLATKLKKMTKAGVIAVNPVSGAEAKIRSHRYTVGAKAQYEEGIKILPAAGNSFLKLSD